VRLLLLFVTVFWGHREAYRNGSLTQEGVKRLFKVCNLVQLWRPLVLCCVVFCTMVPYSVKWIDPLQVAPPFVFNYRALLTHISCRVNLFVSLDDFCNRWIMLALKRYMISLWRKCSSMSLISLWAVECNLCLISLLALCPTAAQCLISFAMHPILQRGRSHVSK
jgi:hypothetical protein